jgi:hypothetical protein
VTHERCDDEGALIRSQQLALVCSGSRPLPSSTSSSSPVLVERSRNAQDRRLHALHLTPVGQELLGRLREIAEAHEQDTLAGLDDDERVQLAALLARIAELHGLRPGVHPGYRNL